MTRLEDVAKQVIEAGAPALGTALFGPLGGIAGTVLARTLGAKDKSPQSIAEAIVNTPPAELKEKLHVAEEEYKEVQLSALELQKLGVSEVNQTMRLEAELNAKTPDKWWGKWRTWMANALVVECFFWPPLIAFAVFYGYTQELLLLSGMVMLWWTLRFGMLGVQVATGSTERKAAMGVNPAGLIQSAVRAIKG